MSNTEKFVWCNLQATKAVRNLDEIAKYLRHKSIVKHTHGLAAQESQKTPPHAVMWSFPHPSRRVSLQQSTHIPPGSIWGRQLHKHTNLETCSLPARRSHAGFDLFYTGDPEAGRLKQPLVILSSLPSSCKGVSLVSYRGYLQVWVCFYDTDTWHPTLPSQSRCLLPSPPQTLTCSLSVSEGSFIYFALHLGISFVYGGNNAFNNEYVF